MRATFFWRGGGFTEQNGNLHYSGWLLQESSPRTQTKQILMQSTAVHIAAGEPRLLKITTDFDATYISNKMQ